MLAREKSILGALLTFLLVSRALALDISYCSPQNNAGSFPAYNYPYQSNGECQGHCQGSYAFAVLQGNDCWCSNYIPEEQVSTSNCNQACPGYPNEWCGSTEAGLYGYFRLSGVSPSGTSAGSSTSTTARSSSSRPPSASVTSSGPNTQQTEVYTSITTVTGEVRTVIVTPTPTATSDASLGQSSGGGGSNIGKVVGIVLGVVLGVIAIIAVAIWFWLRRRRQQNGSIGGPAGSFTATTGDSSPSNNIPSRQVSQMSSAGLLGSKAPRINTLGMPIGSDPRSADTASSGFDRRSLGTDQRLNPYALYIHDEGRVSDVSLQDNQDYSRQLRVANPDT